MKTLTLENMSNTNGGGSTVGNVINGLCGAGTLWTAAAAAKLVASLVLPSGVGQAAFAICTINMIGTGFDWW